MEAHRGRWPSVGCPAGQGPSAKGTEEALREPLHSPPPFVLGALRSGRQPQNAESDVTNWGWVSPRW